MQLLHIDSSIQGEGSATRSLTREIVARWRAQHPHTTVVYRDLAATSLSHFDGAASADTSVLEEFLRADVIVVGAPIYNFAIPSQLKAWIDRIFVAGRTFRYTPNGPQGLAGGKRVIVASARGGVYPADAGREFGESYLRFVFQFLGIHELSFVRAEGLSLSSEQRERALRAAHAAIVIPTPLAA
jgi:FMN-dependent NADH-azoreductase